MDNRGWLERVIRTLASHACGGDPPEFRVEKLNQLAAAC